ncbi:hypothetical protein SUDANB58_05782 (plasmid) [Streptomyces sp. enrichment culture]|uniref:zinc finger domain-containing protein n=1 Tax=Streptomyces sp. enrichment culture TaxID=1795815 RepID=UPI003F559831
MAAGAGPGSTTTPHPPCGLTASRQQDRSITCPDGTVEAEAPQKAVRDVPGKPRRKASGQKKSPPLPTMKQLLTVECPACGRQPGQPCTLRQGHRARVEMYRAATGKGGSPEAIRVAVQKGAKVLKDKRAARCTVTSEERTKQAAQSAVAEEAARRKGRKGNPYKVGEHPRRLARAGHGALVPGLPGTVW